MSTPPLTYTCYTIAGYFLRNECVWPLNVELAIHHTHGSVSTDPTIWESVTLASRPLQGKVIRTSLNPRCVDHRVKGWNDTPLWRPLATRRHHHWEMCRDDIIIRRLVYTFTLPRNCNISFECCNWVEPDAVSMLTVTWWHHALDGIGRTAYPYIYWSCLYQHILIISISTNDRL